ncbi:MAG: ATP-binding cassette domain-containing protein [Lachnospiraceae bacterium]|nr:ATP-binding cassette domain-containing protein [Lachnospiraceae bacterium]
MAEQIHLLEVKDLKKHFTIKKSGLQKKQTVKAVDGVSLFIYKGETLGLVGESGCGKTTLGRTIIRLHEPTSGSVIYDGKPIFDSEKKIAEKMLPYRRKMQIIFQDPSGSLDPRMTVNSIIAEPLLKTDFTKQQIAARVAELIRTVGLKPDHGLRYAHEFSGGQRQRIGIARSLATNPEFIVCDEPISALDVSIQAQMINKLEELQEELGLTYMFVSHDLSMVRHISHTVGVMYLGCLVEMAPVNELYSNMQHPYTKALMSAVQVADPKQARANKRILLEGDVPTPIDPPPGCRFKGRCRYATELCGQETPPLRDIGDGHFVACHNV